MGARARAAQKLHPQSWSTLNKQGTKEPIRPTIAIAAQAESCTTEQTAKGIKQTHHRTAHACRGATPPPPAPAPQRRQHSSTLRIQTKPPPHILCPSSPTGYRSNSHPSSPHGNLDLDPPLVFFSPAARSGGGYSRWMDI
jgi:hypothetical protein